MEVYHKYIPFYMSLIMDKRKVCAKLACNKLLLTCYLLLFPLWESVIVLCFVLRYFMSILVLQSP